MTADQDRARLEAIQRELALLSLQSGGFDYGYLNHRDALEKEAAAIRARLGLTDPRPSLGEGPTRTGWILLVTTAVTVVIVLYLISTQS